MNIPKLKTKTSQIAFIILLLSLCFTSCNIFDSAAKKSVRKQVKEVFSQLKTINYSDVEKLLSENENVDTNDIKYLSENFDGIIKEGYFNKANINYHTNYLYKIIYELGSIKEGDTVIDLGSGWGLDLLLLREIIIGEKGKVIGVDINEGGNVIARKYNEVLGYSNVNFILGDAREISLDNNIADVVISNATLTLIAEKEKVFSEIFRVLKNGGNCYIHDAVLYGDNFDLLEKIKNDTLYDDWYINRSIREAEYLKILERIGFKNIKIEIVCIDFFNDDDRIWTGDLRGVSEKSVNKFLNKYRDRIVSAGIYIYAEK
jgi:ubiquinone/menaquinone biosynthesis C-methylase UbiE